MMFGFGKARNDFRLPDGLRIYAIGDIHGRWDLLQRIETRIAADVRQGERGLRNLVIFLGDYIDRGDDSNLVIERLTHAGFAGCEARYLLGNHEDAMLAFLENPMTGAPWLHFGGIATLTSYGIDVPRRIDAVDLPALRDALAARLPAAHLDFLRSLELSIVSGGFAFVHAGIRPGVAFDQQSRDDILTIREAFFDSRRRLDYRVVHGHTILPEPEITPYRVSLDTGAFATGRLTCAVIVGADVSLLPEW